MDSQEKATTIHRNCAAWMTVLLFSPWQLTREVKIRQRTSAITVVCMWRNMSKGSVKMSWLCLSCSGHWSMLRFRKVEEILVCALNIKEHSDKNNVILNSRYIRRFSDSVQWLIHSDRCSHTPPCYLVSIPRCLNTIATLYLTILIYNKVQSLFMFHINLDT